MSDHLRISQSWQFAGPFWRTSVLDNLFQDYAHAQLVYKWVGRVPYSMLWLVCEESVGGKRQCLMKKTL